MGEKHKCCSQIKCCWDTALKHFKGTTLSHTMHLCTCQFLSQIQDLPSPEFPASHPPQEILHFFQVSTQTSPESLRQSETVHPTSLIDLDNMNAHIANLQNPGVELPNSRTLRKCWLPWWKSHNMTVYLNELISSSLKVSLGFSLWSLCFLQGISSFTKQKSSLFE